MFYDTLILVDPMSFCLYKDIEYARGMTYIFTDIGLGLFDWKEFDWWIGYVDPWEGRCDHNPLEWSVD
jgi:hypothetical protein